MSPRSLFSRLLSRRNRDHYISHSLNNNLPNQNYNNSHTMRYRIVQFLIMLTLVLSAIWLLMAIWYQLGARSPIAWITTLVIISLLTSLLTVKYAPERIINKLFSKSHDNQSTVNTHYKNSNTNPKKAVYNKGFNKKIIIKWLVAIYMGVWLIGAGWFISIKPQQNRDWQPDVSQRLSYQRNANNPNLITLSNVRNFDWHNNDDATERWETRTIDLSKLSGVDVINSYWMGPLIAHTLVSFRFEDDRPLSLSLEIRKEKGESFSALGGFFKRFELSLIASEERDIIYTRTNARGEQVYLFPVSHLQQNEVRSLFESYLTVADELNAKPDWYNTLTSNCTNIIFYMARIVSGERLPWDYRIWVSGWLPNYLYEIGMLDAKPNKENTEQWSMDTWYEHAHINPKVKGFNNQLDRNTDSSINHRSSKFSNQIRQDIPIPLLADSQADADAKKKSSADAAND